MGVFTFFKLYKWSQIVQHITDDHTTLTKSNSNINNNDNNNNSNHSNNNSKNISNNGNVNNIYFSKIS